MKTSHAVMDIFLALALFVLAGLTVASWAGLVPAAFRIPAIVVGQGLLLLAIVALVLNWRGQAWSDIGLVPLTGGDWGRGLLAFAACLVLNMLFIQALALLSPGTVESHTERLGAIARNLGGGLTLAGLLPVLAFVGFYEEAFARGLLLSRCRAAVRGFWFPVLLSAVLFGLGHVYQGWIGVFQTTLVGVVLAVATIRWGTLWPAIIAHAVLDIFSVLVMTELVNAGA